MSARGPVVDDPECQRRLLDYLREQPRTDLATLCKIFPWSKQTMCDLLNCLIEEWRVIWRTEPQRLSAGRTAARRVYSAAPPDLAQRASPAAAAKRISKAIKQNADETVFYFHTGTPPDRAGAIQVLNVAGRSIAPDGRRA